MTARHLTVAELAEREQVPEGTVYQWNSRRTGPPYLQIGRHVRYPLAWVEEWEQARAKGGQEAAS